MNLRTLRVAALGALLLRWVPACSDEPLGPPVAGEPPSVFSVSEPVTRAASARVARSSSAAGTTGDGGIAYVSLQSGMYPTGLLALVRHPASGSEVTRPMVDGGLDPVPVTAAVGDTIIVVITNSAGAVVHTLRTTAPPKRRPIVVRTIPPRGKRDVVLNARMVIVFSEPILASTASTIRLLSGGAAIGGSVTTSADGLRAEFRPNALLQPDREYVLFVPTDVRDVDGEALEHPVRVQFTTGNTVAVASVNTDQVALIQNEFNGQLRVFEMTAILRGDGSVTGSFSIFYPGSGLRLSGRVTCFNIVNGRDVWAAGVADDAPQAPGQEWGWHAVDNGPPGNGVPDQLSLAIPITGSLGTAQSFCSSQPRIDSEGNEIRLNDLISGDIVIRTGGDVIPPPAATGMSRIAFAAIPDGGIRVMRADGQGVQALTATRDEWNPSWSPDGSQLAFDRGTNSVGGPDIYVMNADGSGVRKLTSGATFDANPVWSPDGNKMAFYRDGAIWVMNAADGSGATRLTGGAHPSWSPDGARIAFWSGISGKWGVYVVNADGSGLARLTSDTMSASNPAWSPDGRSIAFQGDEGIYVMNADGSNVRRVALTGQTPAWSPDSRMLIYERFGLTVILADGSGMTNRGSGFTPAWSPVGTMPPAPTPSVSIGIAGGDAQTDTVRGTLAQPLSVRLVRDDGTPAMGVSVLWRLTSSSFGASLSSNFSSSDASGIAAVRLTLGPRVGPVKVQASVTDGSARTGGVLFTANAKAGTPVELFRAFMFDSLLAVVDSALEYAVYARDGSGNLVSGAPVDWAVATGGGTIAPARDTTVIGRRAADYDYPVSLAVHSLGPDEGTSIVTATTSGAPPLTFTAIAVSRIVVVRSGFTPDTVTVPSGRTVGWTWTPDDDEYSDDSHNVTFEDDPNEPVSSRTYSDRGFHTRKFSGSSRIIRYRCTLHSSGFTEGEVGVVAVR